MSDSVSSNWMLTLKSVLNYHSNMMLNVAHNLFPHSLREEVSIIYVALFCSFSSWSSALSRAKREGAFCELYDDDNE